MIWLLALIILLVVGLTASAYLLGFRLGGNKLQDELLRVKLDGIAAERALHSLTRQAFVAMAEHAEKRRVS